jgi:solute:Na+ symporter, SSS family
MLTLGDWLVILAYLAISLAIGVYYSRRAQGDLQNFFLGGRSFPGWLAGLSMVATTFAADTPLAVTELVRSGGIAGNWLWWNMLIGGMFTTFFFARLWRRSGVTTDLELIAIRYSGAPARWLRGLKAVYLGLFLNTVIIGWVNLAMVSILQVFFGMSFGEALAATAAVMLLTTFYTSLSGLWGVVVTDAFQFVLAMTGCIVLAYLVLDAPAIGGLHGLVTQLDKMHPEALHFIPSIGEQSAGHVLTLSFGGFLTMVSLQWWASWYPGAEPGGGGYVAQRMLSAKNEREAQQATLIFQLLHYAVRPWPWIIVGLACLILYPNLGPAEAKLGYLYAMRDLLPAGLRGLLLAAFLAAYMSTLSTQLNWGASYLVNDLYLPNQKEKPSQRIQIRVSQLAQLFLMLASLAVTTQLTSIQQAWEFILQCGAGTGLVLILRWYWWRISAWAEIVAMVVPFIIYGTVQALLALGFGGWLLIYPGSFWLTTGITVAATFWASYRLPGTDKDILEAFYQRITPPGWWSPFRRESKGANHLLPGMFYRWFLGIVLVYSFLFGMGALLFERSVLGWGLLALAAASSFGLYKSMQTED